MPISYSGERPETSGDMGFGGRLPPWHQEDRTHCLIREGVLHCYCGNCEFLPSIPRLEDLPQDIPGWTVQKPRLFSDVEDDSVS